MEAAADKSGGKVPALVISRDESGSVREKSDQAFGGTMAATPRQYSRWQLPDGSLVVRERSPIAAVSHSGDSQWFIEALAVGDYSVDGNGLCFATGNLHAAAQARSAH